VDIFAAWVLPGEGRVHWFHARYDQTGLSQLGHPENGGYSSAHLYGNFVVIDVDFWFDTRVQRFVRLVLGTGGHISNFVGTSRLLNLWCGRYLYIQSSLRPFLLITPMVLKTGADCLGSTTGCDPHQGPNRYGAKKKFFLQMLFCR